MEIECPKCNFKNPPGTVYCGKCATPLPSSEDISAYPTTLLQTPIKELTRGSTFAGRYEIIEELGEGGMGKVYRVFDIHEEGVQELWKAARFADANFDLEIPDSASIEDVKDDTLNQFHDVLRYIKDGKENNVMEILLRTALRFVTPVKEKPRKIKS